MNAEQRRIRDRFYGFVADVVHQSGPSGYALHLPGELSWQCKLAGFNLKAVGRAIAEDHHEIWVVGGRTDRRFIVRGRHNRGPEHQLVAAITHQTTSGHHRLLIIRVASDVVSRDGAG